MQRVEDNSELEKKLDIKKRLFQYLISLSDLETRKIINLSRSPIFLVKC